MCQELLVKLVLCSKAQHLGLYSDSENAGGSQSRPQGISCDRPSPGWPLAGTNRRVSLFSAQALLSGPGKGRGLEIPRWDSRGRSHSARAPGAPRRTDICQVPRTKIGRRKSLKRPFGNRAPALFLGKVGKCSLLLRNETSSGSKWVGGRGPMSLPPVGVEFPGSRNLRFSGFRLLTGTATSLFASRAPLRMRQTLALPTGQVEFHFQKLRFPEGGASGRDYPPQGEGRGARSGR